MKRQLLPVLVAFFCTFSVIATWAQNSVTTTTAWPEHTADNLHWRGIPVKAGDSVYVSAAMFDASPRPKRFWKSLAKAVVPAFVLSRVGNKAVTATGEQQIGNSINFGAGVALIPGAIELVSNHKAKPHIYFACV